MIFATVGTQLPFDRMMEALDAWAAVSGEHVVAQVGPSKRDFSRLDCFQYLAHAEVERYFKQARVIVAHAGMGSVLTALKHKRPIILIPRDASRGEHRNDHQQATARWLEGVPGVHIAWSAEQLIALLNEPLKQTEASLTDFAQPEFIARLKNYLEESR